MLSPFRISSFMGMHKHSRFSAEQVSQDWLLWREKTMYMHCVDCPCVLLLPGQEGARMQPHWNLPVEPSQHVVSSKKIILRNMYLIEIFEISHQDVFA